MRRIKNITRKILIKCLFLSKDIEIPDWDYYLIWFSVTIMISGVVNYICNYNF
jgi:hypothetical protein